MTPADWPRVEEIFLGALERPENERSAWIAAQPVDPELKREALSLLEAHIRQDTQQQPEESDVPEAGAAEPAPAPALPRDKFGPYRLVRLLGRGGMSTVYLAERDDGVFERKVAIKLVAAHLTSEDFLRRFRNEGRMLATLDHPNIARVLDGGVSDGGQPYLVLELVDGERLDQYCDRLRLNVAERLRLFRQVCEAVDCAHRNHVLHRDLKPGNILVTADGTVKLLDFGTAALTEGSSDVTATGKGILTPRYASPEQLRGERPGVAGDVYSLGVILFELLTGVWPFGDPDSVISELKRAAGESSAPRLSSAVTEQAAELRAMVPGELRSELSGGLQVIANKTLEHEPARRYGSARALIEDLNRYEAGEKVEGPPPAPAIHPGRKGWRWWAAAAGVAISLLGGWLFYRSRAAAAGPGKEALEQFQIGMAHRNRRTADSLKLAIEAFRKAAVLDPGFAAAHGYLASTCAALPDYTSVVDKSYFDCARQEARRALELDPRLGIAHTALAITSFWTDWNWAAAEPEFRSALEAEPNEALPHQNFGLALVAKGRFAEAEVELKRAQQLQPLSLIAHINLAELWYYSHRFDREEATLRRVLELDPNYVLAYVMLVSMDTVQGRTEEAIALGKKMRSLPEGGDGCGLTARAYARAGKRDEAMKELASCPDQRDAATFFYLGEPDRALDILDEWYAKHVPEMLNLRWDPAYDGLHGTPRFEALVKKIGM